MTTARERMTPDPVCVDSSTTVRGAASTMASADVGSLPVRGEDGRLKGMITVGKPFARISAE